VRVDQGLCQHVRAGEGEFQRPPGQHAGLATGVGQIQGAAAQCGFDHAGRAAAKPHAGLAAVGHEFVERDLGADTGHRSDEILDHPVGLGMVDVEAVELAVADQVDVGAFLGMQHHPGGVDQGLFGWIGGEPCRHRIGADHGGADARGSAHDGPRA